MIRNPIRNSILVAALALLISLMIHVPGLFLVFDGTGGPEEEGVPEATESAAFEDFAEEALQPEEPEPEPVEEVEPEEVILPDESHDIQVASENPQQDVEAPDSGTAAQNQGRIEPTEEVTATAPPVQGIEALTAEGAPDAAQEITPVEPDEVFEATEPEVSEAIEEAIAEALEDVPEIETVEDGELQIAAVTRSPRPPSRPTEDNFGTEDGEGDAFEPQGAETGVTAPLSGLDLLADAGRTALYGRESLEVARSVGNSTQTNYRGIVFQQLNRSRPAFRSEKGSAEVRLQILANGQVGTVKVLRTIGSPNIGFVAQRNIRDAGPFPPPPDGQPVELTLVYQSR